MCYRGCLATLVLQRAQGLVCSALGPPRIVWRGPIAIPWPWHSPYVYLGSHKPTEYFMVTLGLAVSHVKRASTHSHLARQTKDKHPSLIHWPWECVMGPRSPYKLLSYLCAFLSVYTPRKTLQFSNIKQSTKTGSVNMSHSPLNYHSVSRSLTQSRPRLRISNPA